MSMVTAEVKELREPDIKTCGELKAFLEASLASYEGCRIAIVDGHGNMCHVDEINVDCFRDGPRYSKDWLIFHAGDPISEAELYTEMSPGPEPLRFYCALRFSLDKKVMYLDYETISPTDKASDERARLCSKKDPVVRITRVVANVDN